jgi:diguanylate cyclase (GGDEF)-like protein/PAS domain S-box-containing protein
MSPDLTSSLCDPARLASLYRLDLLDSPAEGAFDRLARLAARVLRTPIALISLLDAERQFIKSSFGLPERWASRRDLPIASSLCHLLVATGAPLVVADARLHLLARASPTLDALHGIAYAGAPLIVDDGQVVGSLCVIDTAAREWPEEDITLLSDLAASVTSELLLRGDGAQRKRTEDSLDIRARQQAALADLGQRALVGADLTALFNDAVALVAETLSVEFCEALELMPDGRALRLRAGAGWRAGVAGRTSVGVGMESLAGYTLFSNQPVIVDDLSTETRFQGPALLRDHGVINGVTVIIRGQEQPFGVLSAHTAQQRAFTSDDVHFLQSVANVLGTAAGRKRAEQAIAFQAHLLNMVEQAVIATDMRGIITYWNRFAEQLYGWPPQEAVGRDMLELVSDEQAGAHMPDSIARIRSGERWTGEIRMRRRDGTTFPAHIINSPICDEQGMLAGIVGVSVDVTERKRIEEIQREARDQLESQVALRTAELREANRQLARWVKELEQHNGEVTLLSEMSELLQTCLTVEEAYTVLAQALPRLFANDAGALYVRGDRAEMIAVAEWGLFGPRAFVEDGCWALRRGRPHQAGAGGGPICGHAAALEEADSICVPVAVQGETLGVLYVRLGSSSATTAQEDGHGEKNRPADTNWRLAITVAEHVALALSNLNLRETLRQQAIRDPLTNLFNRRYMEESLEREVSRAERHGSALGIVMLDIDHFKRINDTYGHTAGDTLLRAIGTLLLSHTRGEDIACRYGGEEFTLILPESSLADTWRRAEQLREAIRRMYVHHNGEPFGVVTISAGVASFPEHGAAPEALLRAADQALYQAKGEGRDRVVRQPIGGEFYHEGFEDRG